MPLVQCKARAKGTGVQCKRYAIDGGTVCHLHGGRAPQTRQKALERIAQFRADHFLARHGEHVSPVEDPVEKLLEYAGKLVAAEEFFAAQVTELRYSSSAGEQLRAEVAAWERAIERAVKILIDIQKLGLQERRTRVAEAQGVLLLMVIDRVLARLDLTPAQQAIAVQVIPEELEAIDAPEGQ